MLDAYCPTFLVFGMSYDEYWYGSTRMHIAYRKKYEIEQRKQNEMMWLSGLYMRSAIASVLSDKAEYFDEPLPLTEEDMAERERQEKMKAVRQFDAYARAFNRNFKAKHEGGELNGK